MRRLAAFWFALACAGHAGAQEYDPHQTSREQFRTQVSRLAMEPMVLPSETPDADRVCAGFEQLVAAELQAHGYEVVPSKVFREIWRRYAEDLGGVFDPVTGEALEKKHELTWEHTGRELEAKHGVDAVVRALIVSGPLRFDAGGFSLGWRAAGQTLVWRGERMWSEAAMPQRVEGPYLTVFIVDRGGVLHYAMRAPIEWSRIYANRGYEEKPVTALYQDAQRNQRAVREVFEKLEPRVTPER
jgi:hypothetical protein